MYSTTYTITINKAVISLPRYADTQIRKRHCTANLVGNSDFQFRFLGPSLEAEFQFRLRFRRFRPEFYFEIPISGEPENWNSDLRFSEFRQFLAQELSTSFCR
jgi:hypothetical protein